MLIQKSEILRYVTPISKNKRNKLAFSHHYANRFNQIFNRKYSNYVFLHPLPKYSLRKHAYSNILKILQPKKGNISDKNTDIFHISSQNIDCGFSLEPPRPQFYYIKVGFKGVNII